MTTPSRPSRPSSPSTYVARSPVDLIAIAPHVIGFRPQDSVVLMTFGEPGAAFHARVDLPDDPEAQAELAGYLASAVSRNDIGQAAVLLYSTNHAACQHQGRLLVDALDDAGVDVVDVLRVEDGRFYRPLEDDLVGTPYDVSAHPFTVQRIFEGRVVEESREALAATLVGTDDADRAAVRVAADRTLGRPVSGGVDGLVRAARAEAIWIQGRIRRHRRRRRLLTAEEAGKMLTLCSSIVLRDVAWAEMTRQTADSHIELWRDLVRRAPDKLLPPAAGLLAFAAWLGGEGALAWCAIDRCTAVDPDYSLAHRVAELLLGAVPPSVWEQIPASDLTAFAPPFRAVAARDDQPEEPLAG